MMNMSYPTATIGDPRRETVMTETTATVREHFSAPHLIVCIDLALATIARDDQTLTFAPLAPLDQFHLSVSGSDHR